MYHSIFSHKYSVELEAILRLPFGWTAHALKGFVLHQAAGDALAVVQAGIGPVMGALATQAALQHWPAAEVVISLGVGGALVPELQPGDLCLATRIVKHDTRCAGDLMKPGELWLSDPDRGSKDPGFTMPLDALQWMRSVLGARRFREGTLLSGDEFVSDAARKRTLAALDANALMVDMEAGGIVQAAQVVHGLPCLALRTIADRLDPDQGVEDDYLRMKAGAAECAAAVVEGIWDTTRGHR